ncbi:glycoside hydrolase family 43 protein [Paenibacillus sp. WLX2291]|uniref:glycoside hydrolase family 43 protein n=1 Tax=Paenibacillus sp. WLX2291 TaxID=3296934 RepID=UPI003984560D
MKNGTIWYDNHGETIQAHGGAIIQYNEVYYWYGEHKGKPNIPGKQAVPLIGVSCYSSPDLIHWEYEGLALSAVPNDPDSPLAPDHICERPKVLYCEKTDTFVMWMHLDNPARTYAGAGVAIADDPRGPFTFLSSMKPNRLDSRDMTLFQDSDGTVYLVHAANYNRTLYFSSLTDDYTALTGLTFPVLIDQYREAPAIMKKDGTYYMISSGCTGWSPNSALYAEADYLIGPWKLIDNPCEGPNYRQTFGGQSTYIFYVNDQPHLMLDHWNAEHLQDSGYSILPITFDHNLLTVRWQNEFMPLASVNRNEEIRK